ncbi:MAG: hypothetical protein AABY22_04285 [Nanoarchaeota archaeon]
MTKVKIDRRKNYIMVMDVETAGGLGNPLVYDLGFAICDKQGKIYAKRSFVIKEIFEQKELMQSAYYAIKIPRYDKDLAEGTRELVSMEFARNEFVNLMNEYEVETVSAYNLAFDRRALANTMKNLYGEGKKFMSGIGKQVKQMCIWSFACEVIYTQPTFWKVAEQENWFTECGNMRTSAEIGWRYISGIRDFEESHTGLEDVEIEVGILAKCFSQNKKHESGMIAHPWRIPNKAKDSK